jgi:tetratricopeptide (TPR) repeat protein
MGPHTPAIDDSYRRYVDLLLRHSRLLAERRDEDAETEAVEEEMTRLWDRLDAVQRHSLSGLGSDLNWVRRGCLPAPNGHRPEDVSKQDVRAWIEARAQGDWHGLLHYLRVCSPRNPTFGLAFHRALAWQAIGFPQLAGLFFDLASELDPSNGFVAYRALQTASQVDPQAAVERARTILKDPSRHPASVVALAVTILLVVRVEDGPQIDPSEAAELLRGCLERVHSESTSDEDRGILYDIAALGFHRLGDFPEARHAYEEALRIQPNDATLLVRLGLLLYGREDENAAGLLARAAELQSPLFMPYFFLAHYHISRRHFVEALTLCSQALARTTSDPIRAELLEWAAICESELSFPDEAVEALFRAARVLDPTNERISRNQQAFEAGRRDPAGRPYDFEPADSFKVRREAEILTALARSAA